MMRRIRSTIAVAGATALAVGALSCARHAAGLVDPNANELARAAPDSFRVGFNTSRGRFVVMAHRSWAPNGVDRFFYLASHHYYDGNRFFRVLRGYVAQFGLSGDPRVTATWKPRVIPDDPVRESNRKGRVAFASAGPRSRTTQLFVDLADNRRLDTLGRVGFPPIGEVVEGMDVVEGLYAGYGEGVPRGNGPSQERIAREGSAYLLRSFPKLDSVVTARVERTWP